MPQTALPNLGINYDFDLGAGGWKVPMDTNLFILDRLAQPNIIAQQNDPPGSPALGDAYIVGSVPTGTWVGQVDDIAIFDGSIWFFATPREGWEVFDQTVNVKKRFDGNNWVFSFNTLNLVTDVSTSGRTLLQSDAGSLIRMTGNGTDPLTVTIPQNTLVDLPAGTIVFVEQTTTSTVTVAPGAGVTVIGSPLNSRNLGIFKLTKVDTDVWIVTHEDLAGYLQDTDTLVFNNVTAPTTLSSTLNYNHNNGRIYFDLSVTYTGMDTADIDNFSLGALPFAGASSVGNLEFDITASSGLVFGATDTYRPVIDNSGNILFRNMAGTTMTYDGGQVQANGDIVISGWYKI